MTLRITTLSRTTTSGLYYKHVMIINDDSSIVSKCCFKLDDPRVINYDRHWFKIQATGHHTKEEFNTQHNNTKQNDSQLNTQSNNTQHNETHHNTKM